MASLAWILVRAKGVLWPSDHSAMGLHPWNREQGVEWTGGAGPGWGEFPAKLQRYLLNADSWDFPRVKPT